MHRERGFMSLLQRIRRYDGRVCLLWVRWDSGGDDIIAGGCDPDEVGYDLDGQLTEDAISCFVCIAKGELT